ncbi:MAG: hypothetical protein ABIK93_07020 [candidate division WOR-3 bacterium]
MSTQLKSNLVFFLASLLSFLPFASFAQTGRTAVTKVERVKKSVGGCILGGGGPRYIPVRGSSPIGACLFGYGREAIYFRLNGDDAQVITGLGRSEIIQSLLPSYRVRPELRNIFSSNPRALAKLEDFDRRVAAGENMCCIAVPIYYLGLVPLVYGAIRNNKPILYSSIAVCGVSLTISWIGRFSATAAFNLLDEAIDIYNLEK